MNRQTKEKPSSLDFLRSESMHIEQEPTPKDSPYTEDMSEPADNEHMKRCTRLEVWGTNPVRRSECITNQGVNEMVLVTKANADLLRSIFPRPTQTLLSRRQILEGGHGL